MDGWLDAPGVEADAACSVTPGFRPGVTERAAWSGRPDRLPDATGMEIAGGGR